MNPSAKYIKCRTSIAKLAFNTRHANTHQPTNQFHNSQTQPSFTCYKQTHSINSTRKSFMQSCMHSNIIQPRQLHRHHHIISFMMHIHTKHTSLESQRKFRVKISMRLIATPWSTKYNWFYFLVENISHTNIILKSMYAYKLQHKENI